jgi:ribonuclease inhibitor
MKRCILDGSTIDDAATVYRRLAEVFQFPAYFGDNPDALWDALSEYSGEPIEVVWQNSALSAERLGPEFGKIVAVLEKAALEGRLTLRLA